MRRRIPTAALTAVLCGASMPAWALEVVESVFQVSFTHKGRVHVSEDLAVPHLPGNACYNWYLRAGEGAAPVQVVERLTLPEPIDWGPTGQGPEDATRIEQGGTVAVTSFETVPGTDGWFSHGWCVADGDPTGSHVIEVTVDGAERAVFPFQVVAAANYAFPTSPTYPDRAARTVNDSW